MGEGGADRPAQKTPPKCPFDICNDLPSELDVACSDYECGIEVSWSSEGDVSLFGQSCRATAGPGAASITKKTRPAAAARRYAVVALAVVDASVDDRAIASIAIEGQPTGERMVAVVRGGSLFLCERADGTNEACTGGVPFLPPAHVHLYGTVSRTDPPNATFALAVDGCAAPQLLAATRPFPSGGLVEATVGCHVGPNECTVEYSSSVILVEDEP
jgi:hypothetical protein